MLTELLLLLFLSLASCPLAFFWASCPCCGTCQYCNTRPSEWQVVLSGVANSSCTSCATVDGTYIAPIYLSFSCYWRVAVSHTCYTTDPYGSGFGVDVKMTTVGPNMILQVFVEQVFSPFVSDLDFRKNMGAWPIDCAAVSGEDIPVSGFGQRLLCTDASATCTLTAL